MKKDTNNRLLCQVALALVPLAAAVAAVHAIGAVHAERGSLTELCGTLGCVIWIVITWAWARAHGRWSRITLLDEIAEERQRERNEQRRDLQ